MDPECFPTACIHNHRLCPTTINVSVGTQVLWYIVVCVKRWLRLVLMTDPAAPYSLGQCYGTYDRGTKFDLWLKTANGDLSLGVVWPGMS